MDQIIKDLQQGLWAEVHTRAQPLIEKVDAATIEQFDRYLAQKLIEGSLQKIVAQARMQWVVHGEGKRVRRPGPQELPTTLKFLTEQADKLLDPVVQEVGIGLPIAVPHEVVDERLKLIPNLLRQAEHARLIYEHVYQISRRLDDNQLAALDPDSRDLATRDWLGQAQVIESLEDRLIERLIDLCMVRLRDMVAVLNNRTVNYNDRFKAAQRVRAALTLKDTYWRRFERRKVRDPAFTINSELAQEASRLEQSYRRQASELERKTFFLEEGTPWWIRGSRND